MHIVHVLWKLCVKWNSYDICRQCVIVTYCVDEVELTGDDSDEVTTSSLGLDQSWDTYQASYVTYRHLMPITHLPVFGAKNLYQKTDILISDTFDM